MVHLDANIAPLVNALNHFPGITTIGSCGGHEGKHKGGQWPAGTWYVKLILAHSEAGWRSLEFLAWVTVDAARGGRHITFYPTSAPPFLNTPGKCLAFALEGDKHEDPQWLAAWLDEMREAHYAPVDGGAGDA